jgi:capsule polysaccharide export protein KpsE/RkpR
MIESTDKPWVAETAQLVSELKAELTQASEAVRTFRAVHMQAGRNGFVFLAAAIDARPSLDQQYDQLRATEATLAAQLDQACKEYARVKLENS